MKVNINGTIYDKDDAKISVFDHGLLYGDGVFEGIRFYNGHVFKLDEHLARLELSAKYIMLSLPYTRDEIAQMTCDTIRATQLHNGYVRLVVTRGSGTLGLNPFICKDPQVIIIVDKIALYPEEIYEKGMAVITVPTQRNMNEAVSPCVKSLNYLNNILAKIEALNSNVHEAIMLNTFGFVAECTGDNLFIVNKEHIITPPVYMGALEGITRDTVMSIARELGYTVEERIMARYDIFAADECFLTGTAAEVVPVTRVDGRVIGDGTPGPKTLALRAAYEKLRETYGTPVYE